MSNTADAHIQVDKHIEDREAHSGFFFIQNVASFVFVLPVPAIRCAASGDRQITLQPGLPMAVGIFYDLIPLPLRTPYNDFADKLARFAIIYIFSLPYN